MTAIVKDTRGAAFVEYLVLVGVIALLAFGAYRLFGSSVEQKATGQADSVAALSTATQAKAGAPPEETSSPPSPDSPSDLAPIAAAESEDSAPSLSVILMFMVGLLIAGGVAIASLARTRRAPDAEAASLPE